ncbi:hypothetical protein AAVH_29750 [Aphelenchoides avenae]|nr:hypothetical protein AAVH_29750 [Aphelenchus avenae]
MALEANSSRLGLPTLKDNAGTAAHVSSWESAVLFRIGSDEWRVAEDEESEPLYTIRHSKLPSLTRRYLWNHSTPDVVVTRVTLSGTTVGSCRIKRRGTLLGVRDTLEFYADSHGQGTPIVPAQKHVVPLLPGMGEEALCWKWPPFSISPSWKLVDSNGSTIADYSSVSGTGMLQQYYLGQGTW